MIFDRGRAPLALSVKATCAASPEAFMDLAERAYHECLSGRLLELCGGFLDLLALQRVQIGHQLHRGPAQGLTAARIELSLLDEAAQRQTENLCSALESAGSQLQGLVHGLLRPPKTESEGIGLTLDSLFRELTCAQCWGDRTARRAHRDGVNAEGERSTPLLLSEPEQVLLEGWTLLGASAHRDEQECFRVERPVNGSTTRAEMGGSPSADDASW